MEKITIRILKKMAILIGVSITLTILLLMILILNNRKLEKETLKQEMSQKTTAEDIAESKAEEKREADEEAKRAAREKYLKEKYDTKEIKAARKEIDRLTAEISKNPKKAELYFKRGEGYTKIYKSKEACNDYTKAIELNPKESKYYMSRALIYGEEEIEKAESDFESAFKISNTSDMYEQRANYYNRIGRYDLAISYCEGVIIIKKGNQNIYESLLYGYLENNNFEKVIENADIYIKRFPKYYFGYVYKALVYSSKEENEKALFYYNQGLKKFRKEAELYRRIGVVKANLGENADAIKSLEYAISLKTNEKGIYAQSYSDEAKIYENLENYPKAIEKYEKEIKILETNEYLDKDKNNTRIVYNNIAKLYEKLGNDKKSKEYYEKANEIEEYRKKILGIY